MSHTWRPVFYRGPSDFHFATVAVGHEIVPVIARSRLEPLLLRDDVIDALLDAEPELWHDGDTLAGLDLEGLPSMGIVQYIGAQNPHSEEISVSGYQNFIINATPAEILTLPDPVASYLVGVEPNWWSPAGGWTPPAAGPETGFVAWVYSAYTVTPQNGVVLCDPTSGGSFAVTLLDLTTVGGQDIIFKHRGTANTVTITPHSGQTLDAASTIVLSAGQSCQIYSDGSSTEWAVLSSGTGSSSGVSSFNTRTGPVVPVSGDYTVGEVTGAAPLASPTFTGNPAAPTQAAADDSTKLATTAYADRAASTAQTNAEAASVPSPLPSGQQTTGIGDSVLIATDSSGKTTAGPATGSVVLDSSSPAAQLDTTGAATGNGLIYDSVEGVWEPGTAVTQIIAGTNVTISPSGGTGAVTVNASGGGSVSVSAIQTAMEPGGYSADAHPWPQVDSVSLLDRLRKGYNSPELFTFSTGVNEFDLAYVAGTYYMAYDNKQNLQLIHASTVAGLSSASSDGTVGVSSGTSTARWPSIAYDGTNWHLWVANQNASNRTDHYIASTWAGLASASVNDSWTNEYGDPQVRWNPTDGKWYGGYKNFSTLRIGIQQASSPSGPWTDLGYTFATRSPMASSEEADPCPIFWNGRAYMGFSAYDGSYQRVALVELDPSNSFQALNSPVVLVNPLESWQTVGANKVFAPIFLAIPNQPGQERLYYSQNPGSATTAGWGYVQVGPTPNDGRRPLDILRYDGAFDFEAAGGSGTNFHSSPTFGPSGIAVSGGSSVWGELANPGPAGDFTAQVVFTPSSLPGAGQFGALLIASGTNSQVDPVIGIWIDNNVIYAEVDVSSSSQLSLTGTTVLSTGTTYRVTLRRENGACALYLNGVSQATGTRAGSLSAMTNWVLGANYFAGGPGSGSQPFSGTIQSAALLGEAVPLSLV